MYKQINLRDDAVSNISAVQAIYTSKTGRVAPSSTKIVTKSLELFRAYCDEEMDDTACNIIITDFFE